MKKNRAFLKWAGGKYPLIDDIKRYLPAGSCLIEPFVGAGSVFLNTDYESYILADINKDLIHLYNIVKTRTEDFVRDAREMFTAQFNCSDSFYALRDEFNQCDDVYRRSVLFLYLNRHGYNGLCRYNLSGGFNVPFGRYKKPYFPEDELHWFAEKARYATFVCESYRDTLTRLPDNAVVYCDPPYVPLSATANFTAYHSNSFSLADQQELARLAEYVACEQKVPVLISNHDTALTRQWYAKAELYNVSVRRMISSNARQRGKVSEILALYRSSDC
jgi:DNA adenine methylase